MLTSLNIFLNFRNAHNNKEIYSLTGPMALWHNHNKQECHTIVFQDYLWYNCDKQEYHMYYPYVGVDHLFTGNLWYEHSQCECQEYC